MATSEEKSVDQWQRRARCRAAAAAVLLLFAGGVSGVLVDRLLLLPRAAGAMPLTPAAMADRLNLSPAEEARVRALLDSMHAEVTAAAQQGPDSLRATSQRAHARIEAALPPEARAEFRAWMREHHRQLLERMDAHRGSGAAGRHH